MAFAFPITGQVYGSACSVSGVLHCAISNVVSYSHVGAMNTKTCLSYCSCEDHTIYVIRSRSIGIHFFGDWETIL